MTLEEKEQIIDKMHEKFGKCGCCGKANCAGKKNNSRLPDKIDTGEMLSIIHTFKITEDLTDDAKKTFDDIEEVIPVDKTCINCLTYFNNQCNEASMMACKLTSYSAWNPRR